MLLLWTTRIEPMTEPRLHTAEAATLISTLSTCPFKMSLRFSADASVVLGVTDILRVIARKMVRWDLPVFRHWPFGGNRRNDPKQ